MRKSFGFQEKSFEYMQLFQIFVLLFVVTLRHGHGGASAQGVASRRHEVRRRMLCRYQSANNRYQSANVTLVS